MHQGCCANPRPSRRPSSTAARTQSRLDANNVHSSAHMRADNTANRHNTQHCADRHACQQPTVAGLVGSVAALTMVFWSFQQNNTQPHNCTVVCVYVCVYACVSFPTVAPACPPHTASGNRRSRGAACGGRHTPQRHSPVDTLPGTKAAVIRGTKSRSTKWNSSSLSWKVPSGRVAAMF